MTLNRISYPHPVLGNGDDIEWDINEPVLKYNIADEAIQLKLSGLYTSHSEIDELVNSGKARWHIRVQCSRTYMRENFISTEPEWTKTLSGSNYEGTLEVETKVIAAIDISEYFPSGSHSDYGGVTFEIKSGELLAIGPDFTFHVDKSYDPLKAPVASLIQVKEGDHDAGPFEVVFDDEIIFVELSKIDWQGYFGIKDRVPTILHSAIVLPVLAEAISTLDQYGTTLWAGRLKDLIEGRDIDTDKPLIAAQELLDSPLRRTFAEVNAFLDRGY